MIQTKKLIPAVYSQSYDFSIFTAVLDLVYTARELDILRARNSHLPTKCFEEDISRLSSLFGLGDLATRDLLAEYRLLVKQKGTTDVVSALAQFSTDRIATSNGAKIRIIDDYIFTDGSRGKQIREKGLGESNEENILVTQLIEPASKNARATNELIRELNSAGTTETNDDGSVTMYITSEGIAKAIRATSDGTPIERAETQMQTRTNEEGKIKIEGSKIQFTGRRIAQQQTTIELYIDFSELKSELFELLMRRLAPVNVRAVVKHWNEYEEL